MSGVLTHINRLSKNLVRRAGTTAMTLATSSPGVVNSSSVPREAESVAARALYARRVYHPPSGDAISQRIRKPIEKAFDWIKTVGDLR